MIYAEYIIDKDKTLLTIIFNQYVLDHIKAKCDDYLNLFQSRFRLSLFTLAKCDTGYRIRKAPRIKKMYQIQVRHKIEILNEFEIMPCTYYLKKNGLVKVVIKH